MLSDPGPELRLGRETGERKSAKIIEGMSKKKKKKKYVQHCRNTRKKNKSVHYGPTSAG